MSILVFTLSKEEEEEESVTLNFSRDKYLIVFDCVWVICTKL